MKAFKATVELVHSNDGGRSSPLNSGYIGILSVDEFNTGVQVVLLEQDQLEPGASALAKIRIPHWSYIEGRLQIGSHFSLIEGRKTVGSGNVLEDFTE